MNRQPKVVTSLGKEWGERVAQRRESLGFTQKQLAELCDVSQQTISKIEAGAMIPLDRLKVTLAHKLATTPDELFRWPALADLLGAA